MIFVNAQLMLDKKENHHENADAECQSGEIYEGIAFVFPYQPKKEPKIVICHGKTPIQGVFGKTRKCGHNLQPISQPGFEGTAFVVVIKKLFLKVAQGAVAYAAVDDPFNYPAGEAGRLGLFCHFGLS